MNEWSPQSRDDDLDRADDLLGQADALLRRHRGQSDIEAQTPAHANDQGPAFDDDDDLPILTDIVDDLELRAEILPPVEESFSAAAAASAATMPSFVLGLAPAEPVAQPSPLAPRTSRLKGVPQPASPTSPSPSSATLAQPQLAERLVQLDTAIAREIDEWAVRELPQIIARELDRLGANIQDEALAHLRATLLPKISTRVSSLLDGASRVDTPPDRR